MGLLSILILSKGADIGVKALYVVATIIFISLAFFFLGESQINWSEVDFISKVEMPIAFFMFLLLSSPLSLVFPLV